MMGEEVLTQHDLYPLLPTNLLLNYLMKMMMQVPGDKRNTKFQLTLLQRLTFIIFWSPLIVIKLMYHKRLYRLLMWFLEILHLPNMKLLQGHSFLQNWGLKVHLERE